MSEMYPVKGHVKTDDAVIDYLDYPSGGPPLLLLHATGFIPWLWHPVARQLAGDFHVIAPYICDYRHAEPEQGGLSWMQIASDLAGFCKSLGIEKPYMAGHSMGGAVCSIAAGALGLDPVRMVLIEPIILPEDSYQVQMDVSQHPLASRAVKRRNHWQDQTEARKYLESKPLFEKWDREMLNLYIRYGMQASEKGGICLTCHPRHEASLFMGSMHFNPWPVLGNISCPALVLEGEYTENKGFIDFKQVAKALPKGIYRVVEGAGHLIPMEKPQLTIDIIRDFLLDE
jgi:pimeloyl-ACP methyl ester carboxylesterase